MKELETSYDEYARDRQEVLEGKNEWILSHATGVDYFRLPVADAW